MQRTAMKHTIARCPFALLIALLLAGSAFGSAQDTTSPASPDGPDQTSPPLTAAQKKAADKAAQDEAKAAAKAAADEKKKENAKTPKKKNSDIENIGSRNINKGSLELVSIQNEIQIG